MLIAPIPLIWLRPFWLTRVTLNCYNPRETQILAYGDATSPRGREETFTYGHNLPIQRGVLQVIQRAHALPFGLAAPAINVSIIVI